MLMIRFFKLHFVQGKIAGKKYIKILIVVISG